MYVWAWFLSIYPSLPPMKPCKDYEIWAQENSPRSQHGTRLRPLHGTILLPVQMYTPLHGNRLGLHVGVGLNVGTSIGVYVESREPA